MPQREVGAGNSYPAVAVFTNQAVSMTGRHGVPFAQRASATRFLVVPGAPRSLTQGVNTGEGARPATLPGLPRADDPLQERATFLAKHTICFSFILEGACPLQDCVFDQSSALMPARYFKGQASRKRVAREGGQEVSRSKRRLYAWSDEQAHVLIAYFNENIEAVIDQGVDGPCG